MKDIDIEPFVGKYVELTNFEGKTYRGNLSKIENGKCKVIRMIPKTLDYESVNEREPKMVDEYASISNGYLLQGKSIYEFRKSHIKKLAFLFTKDLNAIEKYYIMKYEKEIIKGE